MAQHFRTISGTSALSAKESCRTVYMEHTPEDRVSQRECFVRIHSFQAFMFTNVSASKVSFVRREAAGAQRRKQSKRLSRCEILNGYSRSWLLATASKGYFPRDLESAFPIGFDVVAPKCISDRRITFYVWHCRDGYLRALEEETKDALDQFLSFLSGSCLIEGLVAPLHRPRLKLRCSR